MTTTTAPPSTPAGRKLRTSTAWRALAGVEVALATTAVAVDLFLPALVIVSVAIVSLLIRHEGLGSLGLHKVGHPLRMVAQTFGLATVWTLVNLALTKPVMEHVSGQRQDMSAFKELQGNLGMLLVLLALSWTLAALVEELAFRGYLLTRMTQVFGCGGLAVPLAVFLSSVIFGLLHTEYGLIGVAVSAVDAIFYCIVRYHYRSLWASICTHGFVNTIGMVAVFAVGPVYGLW